MPLISYPPLPDRRVAHHLRAQEPHPPGHPTLHRGRQGRAVDAAHSDTAALDLHRSGRRLLHVGAGTAHGGVSGAPRAGLHHWLRLL